MSSSHDDDQSPAQHIAVSPAGVVLVFADGVMFLLAFLLVRAGIWEWTLHT